MRLVCVARHAYLSEHLCRIFSELGVQCEAVVGITAGGALVEKFEPHLMIVEGALLSPAVLDSWAMDPSLRDVPVLAVSLTQRPEDCVSAEISGLAGMIYLPSLDRAAARALLESARRPRGVVAPSERELPAFHAPSVLH